MISITTCKRINLFKETVYSMLNHWNDIDKINYWFAVDDYSTQEDRNEMETLFPWIDFYMKTDQQKGYKTSMNIIWNKLYELKPQYWIHIQDDFLFYRKTNYIELAINTLESEYCNNHNVKQILFNRNYAENINDYQINGHIVNNQINDIAFHKHISGSFNYKNCHYIPHFSFRPSIIDTSVILKLGNFDSPNVFFKTDYANKWMNSGYKTGFFKRITSIHIGRLHKQKDDRIENSYKDLPLLVYNKNINTTNYHQGTIGDIFLINLALHFIAKKNNLKVEYQYYNKFNLMGIELFIGDSTFDKEMTISLHDSNFFQFIIGQNINKNVLIASNMWCQIPEFITYIKTYFETEIPKNRIINCNKFKTRYNNNDVFIHVCIKEIPNPRFIQTIDYYDKILSNLQFDKGYIYSDCIDNIICQMLIIKYKLNILNFNDIELVMFSSTCKNIILSSGLFSWIIGFLSYNSNVYFPKVIYKWHGDIYIFKKWKEIL